MMGLTLAWLAMAAPGARAQEAEALLPGEQPELEQVDPFEGLMPGTRLSEEEMSGYFGAALVNLQSVSGSVVTNHGMIDANALNSLGTSTVSGGIFMPTQFTGDYNTVNTVVNIEVHLNTVNITDSAGSSVSVNQSLDFGGGVVGGFVQ
jgi:hypothetical protein